MTQPLPQGFSVRLGAPADAAAVTACVHAAYARWVPVVGARPGPMLDDYAHVLAHKQVHVVELGARVVGVLVLSTTDEGFLLDNVAVHPDVAGRGVGAHLLALAEQEALRQGHAAIYLYTHERMEENIARYRRLRYVEFDRREELGLRRVYLRKTLARAG